MKITVITGLSQKNNAEAIMSAEQYCSNIASSAKLKSAEIINQSGVVKEKSGILSRLMSTPLYEGKNTDVVIARDNLDREIDILCSLVEGAANSSTTPDNERESIVRSAGMDIKTYSPRAKRVFSVTNSHISGAVKLQAEGGAKAHEWQYTSDIEKYTNRISAQTTTKSSTEITGLTKGVCAFFHKPIFPDKQMEWEGPIIITVI